MPEYLFRVTSPAPGEPHNPELMFKSAPISEHSARVLRDLGYDEEPIRLLRAGVPISYKQDDAWVVEYPSGRRVQVARRDVFDERDEFVRYAYDVVRELPPQAR